LKKFRIAVVGCGGMASEWVKCALEREDAQIVALVDLKVESAVKIKTTFNLDCGIYEDLEKAISESNVNLVFDVTIPDAHKKVVSLALNLGCDVFGEKPMASNFEDAVCLLDCSKKLNKSYSVMQNRRYLKQIRELRMMLDDGMIGEVGYIGADFFLGPHFGGFRDIMESPLLLDMAIHTFDQARFIAGADPVSVYCHEFNPPGSWYKGNASAICIFEFSNSSVFCYRGSWCAEGMNTSWESQWRIGGSLGTILWDGSSPPRGERVENPEDGGFIKKMTPLSIPKEWIGNEGHKGCIGEMFSALSEKRKAETDAADNIKSMAMVFGAIESARTGKKIKL